MKNGIFTQILEMLPLIAYVVRTAYFGQLLNSPFCAALMQLTKNKPATEERTNMDAAVETYLASKPNLSGFLCIDQNGLVLAGKTMSVQCSTPPRFVTSTISSRQR
jgi:hypothetical protein